MEGGIQRRAAGGRGADGGDGCRGSGQETERKKQVDWSGQKTRFVI